MIKLSAIHTTGIVFSEIFHSVDILNRNLQISKQIYLLQNRLLILVDETKEKRKIENELRETEKKIVDLIDDFCKKQNSNVILINDVYKKLLNPFLTNIDIPHFPDKSNIEKLLNDCLKLNGQNIEEIESIYESSYKFFLAKIIDPVIEKIKIWDDQIMKIYSSFRVDDVPKKYKIKVSEIVDLLILNYNQSALLSLGRLFEEICTNKLLIASSKGIISKTKEEILSFNFETKINIMHVNSLIPESDYFILRKLKVDRNTGGHYSSPKQINELSSQSEYTVKLCIGLLIEKKKSYA